MNMNPYCYKCDKYMKKDSKFYLFHFIGKERWSEEIVYKCPICKRKIAITKEEKQ